MLVSPHAPNFFPLLIRLMYSLHSGLHLTHRVGEAASACDQLFGNHSLSVDNIQPGTDNDGNACKAQSAREILENLVSEQGRHR